MSVVSEQSTLVWKNSAQTMQPYLVVALPEQALLSGMVRVQIQVATRKQEGSFYLPFTSDVGLLILYIKKQWNKAYQPENTSLLRVQFLSMATGQRSRSSLNYSWILPVGKCTLCLRIDKSFQKCKTKVARKMIAQYFSYKNNLELEYFENHRCS